MSPTCLVAFVFLLFFCLFMVILFIEASQGENTISEAVKRQEEATKNLAKWLNFAGSLYKIIRRGFIPTITLGAMGLFASSCGMIDLKELDELLDSAYDFVLQLTGQK